MVIVIDDENVSASGGIMEKVYRFRHALFVDRLRWEECRRPDQREIDQFDGPGCIHLVRMDQEVVTAYSRLLPTTRPHLLSEVYPHIVQRGPAPRGPGIYEWTRCGTLPSRREGRVGIIDPATADIFVSVAETAAARGIEGLLAQTHPILVNRLMSCGWDVEPLGLPTKFQGHSIVPVYARLTPQTVMTSRGFFGMVGAPSVERYIQPRVEREIDTRLRA
jgi:acyl-homoserine lactone synthase